MPGACLVLKEGLTRGGSSSFFTSPSQLSLAGPEPASLRGAGGGGVDGGAGEASPKMLWGFRGVEGAVRLGEAQDSSIHGLPLLQLIIRTQSLSRMITCLI